MTLSNLFFFIILGIAGGTISATFGIGAGVLLIPALTFFAAIPQKDAQGTALAVMIPMALMGALRYHWNPNIHMDWRIIAILSVSVVIGANIGAEIVERVSNKTLQFYFGCFVLMVACRLIWQSLQTTN